MPFIPGQRVTLIDTVTSPDAVDPVANPLGLVDPDSLSVVVINPAGIVTTYLPTRRTKGVWIFPFTFGTKGTYSIRFIGAPGGVGEGNGEVRLKVVPGDFDT